MQYSDAAAAKEGLLAKGYHVDYANARPATSNGGDSSNGAGGGRMKRDEFRSTRTLNGGGGVGGSENGDDSREINDTESLDNR